MLRNICSALATSHIAKHCESFDKNHNGTVSNLLHPYCRLQFRYLFRFEIDA